MGGTNAVREVVADFYERILADKELAFFFSDVRMSTLKIHQLQFLKLAFTKIPEDMDVVEFIAKKHDRLFREKGLNETHFDLVATHLVASLKHFNVSEKLIAEAAAIVLLRPIFEKLARNSKCKTSSERMGDVAEGSTTKQTAATVVGKHSDMSKPKSSLISCLLILVPFVYGKK